MYLIGRNGKEMINLDASIDKILNSRTSRQISEDYGLGINLDRLMHSNTTKDAARVRKSPVELVEKCESGKFLNLLNDQVLGLDSKSLFCKKKLPICKEIEMRLVSIYNLTQSRENFRITSILASEHLIVLGYSSGKIVCFTHSGVLQQEMKVSKSVDAVVSIEITRSESYLLIAMESGAIFLYGIRKTKMIQHFKIHYSPVNALRFWKASEEYFISGDLSGKCLFTHYEKKLGKVSNSSFSLINGEIGPITTISILHKPSDLICKYLSLIAICGTEKLVIYSIEPKIETIFVIEKTEEVQTSHFPTCDWLIRNSKLYLVLAWENSISIYQYTEDNQEIFVLTKCVDIENDIFKLGLIGSEILFGIGTQNLFGFKVEKLLEGSNEAIVAKVKIHELSSQNLLVINQKTVPIYQHSVFVSQVGIFYFSSNSVYCLQYLNWEGCLEELKEKFDWITCLSLGLNFWKGKYRKIFKTASQTQVQQKLLKLLEVYSSDTEIPLEYRISNCLEICVKINTFDLLNVELYERLVTEGKDIAVKYFISSIEQFVLTGKLKQVSEVFLNKMVDFYQENGRLDILEAIIMHLDALKVNTNAVLGICEDLSLTLGHIFISSSKNPPNFVDPLKITLKSLKKKQNPTDKFCEFYKIMWYLTALTNKKLINGSDLPESLHSSAISSIKSWLKKSKNLIILLQTDPSATLTLIFSLFTEPLQHDSCEITTSELISILFSLFPTSSQVYTQLALFTISLSAENLISLEDSMNFSLVKHLLQCSFLLKQNEILAFDLYHYISQYINSKEKPLFGAYNLEQLDRILAKSLKHAKITETQLEEIFRINSFLPYSRLMIFLCEIQKDYQNCFMYFVKSDVLSTKQKVFKWVRKVVGRLEEPQKFLQTLEGFLPDMGNIDAEKTLSVVQEYFKGKFWSVFKICGKAEKLQLLMLETVQYKGIPEEFVDVYVKVLCLFDRTGLLRYIRSLTKSASMEVIEKCEGVCRKYRDLDATCYLLGLQNKVFEALEVVYVEMKRFQDGYILENVVNWDVLEKYSKFVYKIYDICDGNLDDLQVKEAKGIFTSILHLLLDFYKKLQGKFEYEVQELIKIFITAALHYVNFEYLVQKTIEKSALIPMNIFKEALLNLCTKRSFYHKSLKSFVKILHNELSEKTEKQYRVYQTGIKSSILCKVCELSIQTRKKVKVFSCGHSFHSDCIQESFCIICYKQKNR